MVRHFDKKVRSHDWIVRLRLWTSVADFHFWQLEILPDMFGGFPGKYPVNLDLTIRDIQNSLH